MIQARVLPRVSQEVIDTMGTMYRAPEITPETYRDKLMYEAGQQSVIVKLREMAQGNSINGINREAI